MTCIQWNRGIIWRRVVRKPRIERRIITPRRRWDYRGEGKSKFHPRTGREGP